jgi:signal transduction histidine kinase
MMVFSLYYPSAWADITLTNAEQIRELSATEAASSLPVQLQGVMTTEAGPNGSLAFVMADSTAGIYILGPTNLPFQLRRGDLLAVDGVTAPGEFAPIAVAKTIRLLGKAPVPTPLKVTFDQMIAGNLDAQPVEFSGVVRSWEPITAANEFGKWHMELAVEGGKLTVGSNGEHPPELQPDAEVRVEGVCFYQVNDKRQVLSPTVLISRDTPVTLLKPAPANPFDAPVRSVASLLQFSPKADYRHRVHVRGVVVYQQPPVGIWIRDETSGLLVQTHQHAEMNPGDGIDVVGYPLYGSETPILEDCIFKRFGPGPAPAPVALTDLNQAFNHEEDLVSIDALLTEVQPILEGWSFTLEKNGTAFKAILPLPLQERAKEPWSPGSQLRITGICSLISDDSRPVISGVWRPHAFQILLRSPDDLTVIVPPPWWTPRHIVFLFALITGISLVAATIVMVTTRLRLREQAARRATAEAEFSAILSERNRMAREIHDTLAQGLAATSVQLMLAKKNINGGPDPLKHHLDTAQQLVRHSLNEARNSIWNMRSHILETNDLEGAVKTVLKHFCEGTGVETTMEHLGNPQRFAPVVENNLLRVAQEAISNALKHSHAKKIAVKLEFGEKQFRLIVLDDGTGFDPGASPDHRGGFGLVGMRERATELKGDLKVTSDPVKGTEVILAIPLAGEPAIS